MVFSEYTPVEENQNKRHESYPMETTHSLVEIHNTHLMPRASPRVSPRARIIHAQTINLKPRARLALDIKPQILASLTRLGAGPRFADTSSQVSSHFLIRTRLDKSCSIPDRTKALK